MRLLFFVFYNSADGMDFCIIFDSLDTYVLECICLIVHIFNHGKIVLDRCIIIIIVCPLPPILMLLNFKKVIKIWAPIVWFFKS